MQAFAWARRGTCPCCAALPPICPAVLAAAEMPAAPCVDTHSHVHQQAVATGAHKRTYSAVLAVDEGCWDAVVTFCLPRSFAIPGLGVHPWRVHELVPGWQTRLTARLLEHPGAMVGEIGLCKCAKNLRGPGAKSRVWPLQLDAFLQQLAIAARLRRPASVHCVKAHGALLECLSAPPPTQLLDELPPEQALAAAADDWLPPAIALHSFSGTSDQVHGAVHATRPGVRASRRLWCSPGCVPQC